MIFFLENTCKSIFSATNLNIKKIIFDLGNICYSISSFFYSPLSVFFEENLRSYIQFMWVSAKEWHEMHKILEIRSRFSNMIEKTTKKSCQNTKILTLASLKTVWKMTWSSSFFIKLYNLRSRTWSKNEGREEGERCGVVHTGGPTSTKT